MSFVKSIVLVLCLTGVLGDVSHLKDPEHVKNEKIPVPLLTNELPVPNVEPLEPPKINKGSEDQDSDVTTVVPEVEAPIEVKEDLPQKSHLPILLSAVPVGTGRSLNLAEVDPGFSRPILTTLPNFPFGRSVNLANSVFLPYFNPGFNQQYQFRHVILPENEYLPPAQEAVVQNDVDNEYLPPVDNEYLPPQARNQVSNKLPQVEDVTSDKLTVEIDTKEEDVPVTETPVDLTTTEQVLIAEEEEQGEVKTAEYKDEVEASDSVIVTKQGTAGNDEVVVVHKQQVPEKIEIVPTSGYFYPRPKVLFLYKK